jgi:hypothetical protein
MEPTLADGERVLLRRLRRSPRNGEIVLARRPAGIPVLHRVLTADPNGIVTMGDNRPGPDPRWLPNQIRAIAVAREAASSRWIRLGSITRSRLSRTACRLPMGPARRFALGAARLLATLLDGEVPTPAPRKPRRASVTSPKVYPMSERFDTQWVGLELAVHDRQTGAVHFLNRTAAFVWERRRAAVATDAIVDELGNRHPQIPRAQIAADVEAAATELQRLELLPGEAR